MMKISTRKASTVSGVARKTEITKAAYDLIAENGFEGFRTRQVSEAVGINSATLHYHFPTKNALIRGVVDYLLVDFAESTPHKTGNEPILAIDELIFEFDDVRQRMRDAPAQFMVLIELSIRAWRDPTVANTLQEVDIRWHAHLSKIIQRGIAEGSFRKNLDVDLTTSLIMLQLRGLALQVRLDHEKFNGLVEALAAQIVRSIRA